MDVKVALDTKGALSFSNAFGIHRRPLHYPQIGNREIQSQTIAQAELCVGADIAPRKVNYRFSKDDMHQLRLPIEANATFHHPGA
ncbi:hypothetical protein D3C85_1153460 [compost metagenome]